MLFSLDFCTLILLSYGPAKSSSDLERIEAEYIKNLQQQVYFLELETNYLYPFVLHSTCFKCFQFLKLEK